MKTFTDSINLLMWIIAGAIALIIFKDSLNKKVNDQHSIPTPSSQVVK